MIPKEHLVMVGVAVVILLTALGLHATQPNDQIYVGLIATATGFIFGKFTNGYGGGKR